MTCRFLSWRIARVLWGAFVLSCLALTSVAANIGIVPWLDGERSDALNLWGGPLLGGNTLGFTKQSTVVRSGTAAYRANLGAVPAGGFRFFQTFSSRSDQPELPPRSQSFALRFAQRLCPQRHRVAAHVFARVERLSRLDESQRGAQLHPPCRRNLDQHLRTTRPEFGMGRDRLTRFKPHLCSQFFGERQLGRCQRRTLPR